MNLGPDTWSRHGVEKFACRATLHSHCYCGLISLRPPCSFWRRELATCAGILVALEGIYYCKQEWSICVLTRGGHRVNFPNRLIGWATAIISAFKLILQKQQLPHLSRPPTPPKILQQHNISTQEVLPGWGSSKEWQYFQINTDRT